MSIQTAMALSIIIGVIGCGMYAVKTGRMPASGSESESRDYVIAALTTWFCVSVASFAGWFVVANIIGQSIGLQILAMLAAALIVYIVSRKYLFLTMA